MKFYWCFLKNGDKETCGYIEERGAKVGYKVELVEMDGEFWEVISVNPNPVSRDIALGRNYKDFQHSTKGGGID